MTPFIALGAPLAIWYAAVLAYALATRPRTLPPGPATSEFGPEPPAVVNLLVTRCRLTAEAADATLLDLAARRVVELHQPGADPADLLVRLRGPVPDDLAPYERRVLDRVRDIAGDRLTPLREIHQRYADGGPRWLQHLRAEVIADARSRGLVRHRLANPLITVLTVVVALLVACWGVVPLAPEDGGAATFGVIVGAGVATLITAMILLMILVLHLRAPAHTAAGRAVGSRWLGFGRWLAGYESLADLPPAAVALWDRYLAYGVALGVNPVAERALDLRVGRTVTVLSRATGQPRPVRVRYPRDPLAYTQSGVRLVFSLGVLAAWAAFWVYGAPRLGGWPDPLRWLAYAAGVAFPIRALYKVVRAGADKLAPATVTGQVLGIHPYQIGRDGTAMFTQLVVDDGRSGTLRPWLVRADRATEVRAGDVVRLRAQPWSGYVLTLDRLPA
jgi:hypothetical protein